MTPRRRRPTIIDVAKAAGVSVGTVSHVLNDIGQGRPATRALVEAAIQRLAYRPNALARSLTAIGRDDAEAARLRPAAPDDGGLHQRRLHRPGRGAAPSRRPRNRCANSQGGGRAGRECGRRRRGAGRRLRTRRRARDRRGRRRRQRMGLAGARRAGRACSAAAPPAAEPAVALLRDRRGERQPHHHQRAVRARRRRSRLPARARRRPPTAMPARRGLPGADDARGHGPVPRRRLEDEPAQHRPARGAVPPGRFRRAAAAARRRLPQPAPGAGGARSPRRRGGAGRRLRRVPVPGSPGAAWWCSRSTSMGRRCSTGDRTLPCGWRRPATPVVDATGAGDAFAGRLSRLLAARRRARSRQRAARWSRAASPSPPKVPRAASPLPPRSRRCWTGPPWRSRHDHPRRRQLHDRPDPGGRALSRARERP